MIDYDYTLSIFEKLECTDIDNNQNHVVFSRKPIAKPSTDVFFDKSPGLPAFRRRPLAAATAAASVCQGEGLPPEQLGQSGIQPGPVMLVPMV